LLQLFSYSRLVGRPKVLGDPFAEILDHLYDASTHVEEVYQMDKSGSFVDKTNDKAARLVKRQLAKAAELLRDLTYTAWVNSGEPAAPFDRDQSPTNPSNPRYNPATGSAPPSAPVVRRRPL
jgi:hypothetical protein